MSLPSANATIFCAATTPTLVAVAVAFGALVASYLTLGKGVRPSRRILYGTLRAVAVACLALVLLRPERIAETEITRRRTLAVMLDASRSMSFPVEPGSAYTRRRSLEDALASASAEFSALRSRFDLAVYEFDSEARRLRGDHEDSLDVRAPSADGGATALGASLLQVLDEQRGGGLDGILLFSDGASNLGISIEETAREFAATATPVHAIALGEAGTFADLSVESLDVPRDAAIGVPFRICARLQARGADRQKGELIVRVGRTDQHLKEVARQRVLLAGDGAREVVQAAFTPRAAGTLVVEAEVVPDALVVVTANNSRTTFVGVEERRVRVLYVEGVLRPDFGAIRRSLAGGGQFDLDIVRAFLRRGGEHGSQGTPGHETDGIKTDEYDVFLLGELDAATLEGPFVNSIRRLVSLDGRGLVVFSGPGAFPQAGRRGRGLADLLPVRVVDAKPLPAKRVGPTAEGIAHPALASLAGVVGGRDGLSSLGPLSDLPTGARVRRAGAVLLATPSGVPVLVSGRRGSGRVAALLSGRTRVWMDDPSAPEGTYERLVRSIVSWAAGRESSDAVLSLSLSRHSLYVGDEATLTVRVNRARAREAGLSNDEIDALELLATVRAQDDDNLSPQSLRLRKHGDAHRGAVRARSGGVHSVDVRLSRSDVRIPGAKTVFVVEVDRRELSAPAARPGALMLLAETTGGFFGGADDTREVLGHLIRRPEERITFARRRRSVWDSIWAGMAFLGAVFLEWWMRRR